MLQIHAQMKSTRIPNRNFESQTLYTLMLNFGSNGFVRNQLKIADTKNENEIFWTIKY